MRLAYLITAYDQPDHLLRLVNVLDCPSAVFYVHIDKKVDITPFLTIGRNRENVHFVPNRVDVSWMGFSQVESILTLLSRCSKDGFDYCVLLSGSDYPIKSKEELVTFFEKAEKEYIAFWRLEDRPSWKHKVLYYYPIDMISIWGHSKNSEPSYWRRLFWGRFYKYRERMPTRAFLANMVPYGGSDWWMLSSGCVAYILKYLQENPAYSRFYRYAHCPSELFFHTIVLNSEWGQRVLNFENYQKWSSSTSIEDKKSEVMMLPEDSFNLRYIDWSGEKTGQRETPAVLDERDWEKIRNSSDLFARKFHPRLSYKLLNLIDQEILRDASFASANGHGP